MTKGSVRSTMPPDFGCTGAGFDTKVAVYNGSGCPAPGTAITCNDDACATASEICFDVTVGQAYLIRAYDEGLRRHRRHAAGVRAAR